MKPSEMPLDQVPTDLAAHQNARLVGLCLARNAWPSAETGWPAGGNAATPGRWMPVSRNHLTQLRAVIDSETPAAGNR